MIGSCWFGFPSYALCSNVVDVTSVCLHSTDHVRHRTMQRAPVSPTDGDRRGCSIASDGSMARLSPVSHTGVQSRHPMRPARRSRLLPQPPAPSPSLILCFIRRGRVRLHATMIRLYLSRFTLLCQAIAARQHLGPVQRVPEAGLRSVSNRNKRFPVFSPVMVGSVSIPFLVWLNFIVYCICTI